MMDRENKFFTVGLVFVSINFLIAACASIPPTVKPDGIAWGEENSSSNGEYIGFINIRERDLASKIHSPTLQDKFDADKFHMTLKKGQSPDGAQLNADIPGWNIGNNGKANLFAYIKALP
jgi:hypothetical protein